MQVQLTVGGALATAYIRMEGVRGDIAIEQPKLDDPSTVTISFNGLDLCTPPNGCNFHVHENAVRC